MAIFMWPGAYRLFEPPILFYLNQCWLQKRQGILSVWPTWVTDGQLLSYYFGVFLPLSTAMFADRLGQSIITSSSNRSRDAV